jgi:hypothetical protein
MMRQSVCNAWTKAEVDEYEARVEEYGDRFDDFFGEIPNHHPNQCGGSNA